MNRLHVFCIVFVLHAGVLGVLIVFPGCKSSTDPETVEGAAEPRPTGQDSAEAPRKPVREPTPAAEPVRLPPSEPDWNLNQETEALPLPGYNAPEADVARGVEPSPPVEVLRPVDEPGPRASGPSTQPGTAYTVQRGDTLSRIARRFNTSVAAIQTANGIDDPRRLRPGQELVIPGDSAGTATTAPPSPAGGGAATGDGQTYTVRSGDTLSRIASRHGTTVAALREANGISGDTIYVGQELTLPGGSGAGASSRSPSSSSSSSSRTSAAGDDGGYVVRQGDTLSGIASRLGTTVDALMRANGLTDPDRLRVGQTLTVGEAGGRSASQPNRADRSGTSDVPTPRSGNPRPASSPPGTSSSSNGQLSSNASGTDADAGDDDEPDFPVLDVE